ncbi:hypothetical protein RI129_005561 [Pyrocoelia pectoralis]|uniref:C2H2-type domain-containing protein n=1 Tax=Pyrocoelia pectoralis TaxID=417401 RepID=A0AAN7VFU8_9COLE
MDLEVEFKPEVNNVFDGTIKVEPNKKADIYLETSEVNGYISEFDKVIETKREDELLLHTTYEQLECKSEGSSYLGNFTKSNKEVVYKGNDCQFAAKEKRYLQDHVRRHRAAKLLQCEQCSFMTKYKRTLILHSGLHHNTEILKCDQCSYITNQYEYYQKHIKLHNKPEVLKCDQCIYATMAEHNLKLHMMKHNPSPTKLHMMERNPSPMKHKNSTAKVGKCLRIFKCEQCSFTTRYKKNLSKHSEKHNTSSTLKFEQCSYTTTSMKGCFKLYVSEHDSSLIEYKCTQCSFITDSKHYLSKHSNKHKSKILKCELCPYVTNQKCYLKKHINIHINSKAHKCNQCEYTSLSKYRYKLHVIKHNPCSDALSSVTEYKCNLCSYTTKKGPLLRSHYLKHSFVKPYKCNRCSFATKYKKSLFNHVETHNKPSIYKCEKCNYSTQLEFRLKQHMIRQHALDMEEQIKPFIEFYKCDQLMDEQEKPDVKPNLDSEIVQHNPLGIEFKCIHCGYITKDTNSYRSHVAIHNTSKVLHL